MPIVVMPDGTRVDMPDKISPELGQRLRALDTFYKLGAKQKPDQPGYTFFPNGVTYRHADKKLWIPAANSWFSYGDNGLVADGEAELPDSRDARDQAQMALEIGKVIPRQPAPSQGAVQIPMMASHGVQPRQAQDKAQQAATSQFRITPGGAFNLMQSGNTEVGIGHLLDAALASGGHALSGLLRSQADVGEMIPEAARPILAPFVPGAMSPERTRSAAKGVEAATEQVSPQSSEYAPNAVVKAANWAQELVGGVAPMLGPQAAAVMGLQAYGRRSKALAEQGVPAHERAAKSAFYAIPDVALGIVGGALGGPEATASIKSVLTKSVNTGTAMLAKHYGDTVVDEALGITPPKPGESFGDWLTRATHDGGLEAFVSGALMAGIPEAVRMGKQSAPSETSEQAPANEPIVEAKSSAAPVRTAEQIRAEAAEAARNGDIARIHALKQELYSLAQPAKPAFREATPEEAARAGKYEPLRASDITPDLENALGEVMSSRGDVTVGREVAPGEAHAREVLAKDNMFPMPDRSSVEALLPPENSTYSAKNERRNELESGMYGTDPIDMLAREQEVQQRIAQLESAAERRVGSASNRAYRRILERNPEYVDLKNELDLLQQHREVSGNWTNTREAWENLKAEMKKPGGQRGAIGPDVDQGDVADIPARVAELVAAGAKDGYQNASEWLAAMRDKMSREDFEALYRAVGGVQGANRYWSNNERASSMADKTFTNRETGETFPLQTEVNGNQVTTVGNRKGVDPAQRPSATITVNEDGSLHLDGIDNKGQRGTGNEMFRKTVLAALNNGGDERGFITAEATPQAREMLSRYQGFEADGRLVRVPTESVLYNKTNPQKMKFASAGLNPFEAVRDMAEAAKRELGLPEGATDIDLAKEVMSRIGRLGATVRETAVRIMAKVKGVGRDLANAIAEHLHEAFSGSRESQLGAVGEKPKYTPEEEAHYQEYMKEARDLIAEFLPGDENKSARAEAYKKLPSKANVIADFRKANATAQEATPAPKPDYEYRPSNRPREGSIPDAINEFLDQMFRRAFPSTVDQAGARAGDIFRFHKSKAATAIFKINRNVRETLVDLESQPTIVKERIADAIESPSGKYTFNDKKIEKAVNFVKAQSKEMGEALVKAGAIKNYVENYLHHAFKETPEQIETAIKKKSPTGDLSYFIERHGPDTYAIAKDLELTPKEPNPFQNFFDDFINKQKFLVAHNVIKQLMREGLITNEAHPGFVRLNDYLRNAVAKARVAESGDFYAPKSVADLLNNHLGQGFERNAGFRSVRAFNSSMNHVEMGLSFFHGMFILRDISNTMLGSGITAIARGDFKEGFRQLAIGALPIKGHAHVVRLGSEIRDMLAGQREVAPELEDTIHAYHLGGGQPDLSPEYINDTLLKMKKSWARAKDVKLDKASRAFWGVNTLRQIPFAAIESAAHPIMEMLVPNAKAGAFAELWKVESKRLPPNATDAQKAVLARKLVNDIDDRMGQLIYDNLHLPNALRQVVTLGTRAAGWDIGSLRAIYGGVYDFAKAGKMVAQDIAGKAGVLSPEQMKTIEMKRNAQGIWGPKSYMTQRMGYAVASAMAMAITNGLLTYVGNKIHNALLKPGEKPSQEIPSGMDFVFPRYGDYRFSLAGYEKEAVEQYLILKNLILHHDPSGILDYISQKASPIIEFGRKVISGRDWQGNETSRLWALPSMYLPFSTTDMGKPEPPTSWTAIKRMAGPHPAQTLGRFIGVTPAPKRLIQSDAENKALEIFHEFKGPLTAEAADHRAFVNRMALYYKAGDMDVIRDANKRGLLTDKDNETIARKAQESDLLAGVIGSRDFPPEKALEIYRDYATPEERKRLMDVMGKKKRQALSNTPRAELTQRLKEWSIVK